jgi:APA family basic amino acid/polyamine antiporter
VIPARFSKTTGLSGTPLNAIVLQSLWASVLILSGTFERLVIYSGVVLAIFSALAVGSVMVLRRRHPELARPYRVPLYPLVPLCYVVLSSAIAVYGLIERPIEAGLGIATVMAGVPLYALWTQMRSRQRN